MGSSLFAVIQEFSKAYTSTTLTLAVSRHKTDNLEGERILDGLKFLSGTVFSRIVVALIWP